MAMTSLAMNQIRRVLMMTTLLRSPAAVNQRGKSRRHRN